MCVPAPITPPQIYFPIWVLLINAHISSRPIVLFPGESVLRAGNYFFFSTSFNDHGGSVSEFSSPLDEHLDNTRLLCDSVGVMNGFINLPHLPIKTPQELPFYGSFPPPFSRSRTYPLSPGPLHLFNITIEF